MAETDKRVAMAQLHAAAIRSCEREIASMNAAIQLLERDKRRRIEEAWPEGSSGAGWRRMTSSGWSMH